ncbi:nicotinate-nucleotide adenylyltransferase [Rubrivirga sp.]|uniref:nicotinate-nucleotide adenylyltransferase n=1 Tax=Rubrivirga sp. TaxID=1885344 RepID=UPI003C788314
MTGIFGGSFNPPHVGHLAVAEACREAGGLERVLWMPASTPPHKRDDPDMAPASTRLEMVKAAIATNDRFEVSALEVERRGVSYTVDTVRALESRQAGAANDQPALIIGGDSLAGFERWREPREIVARARLVVYRRPGDGVDLGALPHWLRDVVTTVEGPGLEVSSTEVRARIAAGRTVRYLVPDPVLEVVRANGLYREGIEGAQVP